MWCLLTDLFARQKHKVIPHGSTALTDILPPPLEVGGDLPPVGACGGNDQSVGITIIKIKQIDFANPLCLFLYRGARASAAQALDGLRSCAVVSG